MADIGFGPTANGKMYLCLGKHRGEVRSASRWLKAISLSDEYELFCSADASGWLDVDGHYWSCHPDASELGTKGERIAKHPRTANPTDPWHGYPASPRMKGSGDCPGDDLIDRWLTDGHITRSFAKRLRRRAI